MMRAIVAAAGSNPEHFVRFIDANIESIDQLEILRVLGEDVEKTWAADKLAVECQIKPSNIAANLAALEKRGLLRTQLQESSLVARFVQTTPEMETALRQLLQFYQERPVTLIKLIYARANDRLNSFAEAFRLRKED
jgi:DNA-binding MarR family transcriptional regulator